MISSAFQDNQNNALHAVEYIKAARKNAVALSAKIEAAFWSANQELGDIRPIFFAAANTNTAKMDKLPNTGKGGQALYDKPGMHYGGNNLDIGKMRKLRRSIRLEESRTYKIANF